MSGFFYARAEKGQIRFDNRKSAENYLASMDGQRITVRIDRMKWKRSLSQNSFYWLWLTQISKDTGNLEDDLHQLFKRKFLPLKSKTVMGVEFRVPSTTSELDKVEFGEYLDKISAFTGIPIPDPQLFRDMYGTKPEYPDEHYQPKF